LAPPLAADRRNPLVLLSLLLSAVHQKVVEAALEPMPLR
jgi:hypothetical protein